MPILRRKYRYTDGVSTVLVDLPSFLIIFTILTQDPSSCGTVALVGLGKVCFSLSYLYDVLLNLEVGQLWLEIKNYLHMKSKF